MNPSRPPNVAASAHVQPNVILEDDVAVGPGAVILAHASVEQGAATFVREGACIGANATVYEGVTIGARARVSPGAVVTRSVPALAIVEGNPAHIVGYVETDRRPQLAATSAHPQLAVMPTCVGGVTLHRLKRVEDMRGALSVGEFPHDVPFLPERYFLVFKVPSAETRGEHAHYRCKQFLIAVSGSLRVVVDNGHSREEILLDRPDLGLYLPAMTWGIQYCYSPDAILLVFASEPYDASDYIRNYDDFLAHARNDVGKP